jgi:hypothetical protein
MKMLMLAAVAATLSLPATPILAMNGQGIDSVPAFVIGKNLVERRSGRCPSGEGRPYVSGCGGA